MPHNDSQNITESDAATLPNRFQPLTFSGTAGDYFKIHFVNLFLSIITIGLYVPWARVRHRRFFYSNTRILGDGIDYLARGIDLLKGWLIAMAVLISYNILPMIDNEYAVFQLGYTGALILLAPWAINKSLQFNARNLVWRDVRFKWDGTYFGVAIYLFLGPLIGLLSFGLLLPIFSRLMRHYIAKHYSFGTTRFTIETSLADFYKAALAAVGVFIGVVMVVAIPVALYLFFTGNGKQGLTSVFAHSQGTIITLIFGGQLLFIGLIMAVTTYYRAVTRNLMVTGLALGDDIRFRSDISAVRLVVITLQNAVLSILSLSLLWPWAQVRKYRYMVDNTWVRPNGDLDHFIDQQQANSSALGDALSEAGGIEISI